MDPDIAPSRTTSLHHLPTEHLDRALRAPVDAGAVPGVVVALANGDGLLYHKAFGHTEPTGRHPMSREALFRIASMTKPIVSLGVMMLVEEGAVSLDDEAADHLPELEGREVLVRVDANNAAITTRPPVRPITVRDLLRHTSGFGYPFSNPDAFEVARVTTLRDRDHPLVHDPGARWTYGMSTAFLGWLIEAVTGQSLPDFLHSRILQPLGMGDTSYELAADKRHRLVPICRRVNGTLEAQPTEEPFQPHVRGDGGLLSTARDYARFTQLIIGRGTRDGVTLVRPETIAEMSTNQLGENTVLLQPSMRPDVSKPFPEGAGRDGFGLGFQIAAGGNDGARRPGSLSWPGLYNTFFWIDLEYGIACVLLLQVLPFYDNPVAQLLTDFERALYATLP